MSEDESKKSGRMTAYNVRETEDGKSYFNRIGAAFPHKDGQGYNLHLEALPVSGQVVMRTVQEKLDSIREEGRKDARSRDSIDRSDESKSSRNGKGERRERSDRFGEDRGR